MLAIRRDLVSRLGLVLTQTSVLPYERQAPGVRGARLYVGRARCQPDLSLHVNGPQQQW